MFISERAKNIAPSVTLSIDSKAKKMKQDGLDIISFGAGEPDFDTPDNIKQQAIIAIQKGFTKYTPVEGTIELKKAICAKFKKDNNLDYAPENIVVSCGAKHSLYNVFQCILNPGDEVIIPVPYWVSYPEMVKAAGGVPVFVETDENKNFVLTGEKLLSKINSRTRAIIINSPSNPSGMLYTKQDLKEIADIAVKNNIWVVSDEIYEKLIYDGATHTSIASLGEDIKNLSIVVNGVSKTYAMTGWRIGYLACDKKLAKAIGNLQSHSTSNPCSISQYASIEALLGSQQKVEEMLLAFDKRRKYIVKRLNELPKVTCKIPQGAFYAYPNISGLLGNKITSAMELCDFMLEKANVATVPGEAFGTNNYIRLSYATSMENIEKGLDRMDKVVRLILEI